MSKVIINSARNNSSEISTIFSEILEDICKIYSDPIYIGRDGGFNGLLYNLSYNPDVLNSEMIYKLSQKTPPINSTYFNNF